MTKADVYQSEAFIKSLSKCKLFRLKYPKGGQYNDGFELLGELVFSDEQSLLEALSSLGVEYSLHKEKPESWCPPSFDIEGVEFWLEYKNECECFGYKTYVCIGTGAPRFSIEFNFNSTSRYDVLIEDVRRAISFESVLVSRGLLSLTKICT